VHRKIQIKIWLLASSLILLLSLQGCSLRKIILQNAEWLTMRQVDKWFALTPSQRDIVKPEVTAAVKWFKTDKLPEVRALLRDIKTEWERGITEDKLVEFDRRIVELRVSVISRIAEPAGKFLATLDEGQLAHLEKQFKNFNKRLEKSANMPPDEWQKTRRKETLDELEEWFGDLSKPDAEKLLETVENRDHNSVKLYLEARSTAQQTFVSFLQERKPANEIASQLVVWAEKPELMRGSHAHRWHERLQKNREKILALDKLITPEQRFLSLQRIQGFIDDLTL
jgi:hypothetical protein